jgi:hypothetical protein
MHKKIMKRKNVACGVAKQATALKIVELASNSRQLVALTE